VTTKGIRGDSKHHQGNSPGAGNCPESLAIAGSTGIAMAMARLGRMA